MIVDNPFYVYEHVRYTCKPSGQIGVVGQRCYKLEVPDDTQEVLIEVVNKGRSTADKVFAARIWSKAWGEMDVESHMKKVQIEKEVAEHTEKKQQEVMRKGREAQERAEAKRRWAESDRENRKPLSGPVEIDVVIPKMDMGGELKL
jgi:hypothetical protein